MKKIVSDFFSATCGGWRGNPVALIVLIGITILPSLYAWVKYRRQYGPYGNTSGVKVAVANNDKEAVKKDLSINAGKEIIDNLKKTTSWAGNLFPKKRP